MQIAIEMGNKQMKYTHRYLARITLEAETALFVGSGETSLLNDALVQKDHHGFPMIQGSSLAGVLRHALEDQNPTEAWASFFGYIQKDKNEGLGSKVKISSAYFLFPDQKIAEGLRLSEKHAGYLTYFETLPLRQHVRITHRGGAADKGLFQNEVVYKGCRFLFEIEAKGDGSEKEQWEALLRTLKSPLFRIGQGTRNGYGRLAVIACVQRVFDLREQGDFKAYLEFDPSFNSDKSVFACEEKEQTQSEGGGESKTKGEEFKADHYRLLLRPDSFFIFGSGHGDEEVDDVPYTEDVLLYKDGEIKRVSHTVIPASSVKGTLSHRTCFHYNKSKGVYADEIEERSELENHVGENNRAVAVLFGKGGDEGKEGYRGRVIINDLYYPAEKVVNDKIFNHVAIDRFTGGALSLEGALFSEKVSRPSDPDFEIKLDVWVEKIPADESEGEDIQSAFEEALKDICRGLLPLGGMTTKGYGIFNGSLFKNGKPLEL